jgi:hypothetical protein
MALKQLHHRRIAQGFRPPSPTATHEKDKGGIRSLRPFLHDIRTDHGQRLRIVQIYQPFHARFRPHAFGVIGGTAHEEPPPSILNVLQPQV